MIEQRYGELRYLQFNLLSQFPELTHAIFTRWGGYSEEPYKGLNTSTSLKSEPRDSVDHVVRNRQLALQALGMEEYPCVTLWQIHSAHVAVFESKHEWRTDWAAHSYYERAWSATSIRKGDAILTEESNIALALSFADCVPILLYDPVRHVIGITHAGWRGSARGIAVGVVEAMAERFQCRPGDILAGIAPAIGSCCYEISEPVRALFLGSSQFDELPTDERYRGIVRESAMFTSSKEGRLYLDLWETNRRQLLMAGLLPEHIEISGICTRCHIDLFFSHRGEQGRTGRFPIIMALTP